MKLADFNSLDKELIFCELEKCCGSSQWIKAMIAARPYASKQLLHEFSDKVWNNLDDEDYLQAFTLHPQIGDIDSLKKKFASTASWAGNEQKGTSLATDEVLTELKNGNDQYLNTFGFIFIVCATGKSAQQMLDLLTARLNNDKITELLNAAAEQNKITHLRLDKLLENKSMSPITTHVLDTAKGCPAANISVTLEFSDNGNWATIATGTTDDDGRIMDWFNHSIKTGEYKITFTTAPYHNNKGFFPSVTINFTIDNPDQHYHVPLLLSPFSFSTYRGS